MLSEGKWLIVSKQTTLLIYVYELMYVYKFV